MRRRLFILAVAVAVALAVPGCRGRESETPEPAVMEVYYFNVCGSCDPEDELRYTLEQVSGVDLAASGVAVRYFNVYEEGGQARWDSVLARQGLSLDEMSLPAALVDGRLIHLGDTAGEDLSHALSDMVGEQAIIGANDSVVVVFTAPGCHECADVEEGVLAALPASIELDRGPSPVRVIRHTIADAAGAGIMRSYCSYYGVPEDRRKTPLAFVSGRWLQGAGDINGQLMDLLAAGRGLNTPVLSHGQSGGQTVTWYGVLGMGLVNGINPCAISMVLLLLSLVAIRQKWLLPMGLAFALGKFAGFFLLGTVLFGALDRINFTAFGLIAKGVLLCGAAVMIALNLNDYFAARSERYQRIRLQLPRGMRRWDHALIKRMAGTDGVRWLIPGALVLGLLLSLGEFLCTGQLYLTAILYMIHTPGLGQGAATLYLALYSAAFVAPIVLLTVLVMRGRAVFALSEFFRRREGLIKLINAGVFLAFGVLVLLFY